MLIPSSSTGLAHVILMRFNVRTKHSAESRDAAIRAKKDWLNLRFDLFERICLPTMFAQTSTAFELHVYFDDQTPQIFLERFDKNVARANFIKRKLCDFFDSEVAAAGIREELADDVRFVLTTRLDNDDGLHRDFVRRVQSSVKLGTNEAINFPLGIVLADGAAYLSKQKSNAFVSLLECRECFRTVLQESHNRLAAHFPVRDVDAEPMWLQHVHGGNVSNKIRGRRLTHSELPVGFECLGLETLVNPLTHRQAIVENITVGGLRASRDLAARIARSLHKR